MNTLLLLGILIAILGGFTGRLRFFFGGLAVGWIFVIAGCLVFLKAY